VSSEIHRSASGRIRAGTAADTVFGIVNAVADRVRAELLRRIGLEDVLKPRV